MNENFDTTNFYPLGVLLTQTYEKTAADKASESLVMDTYLASFEAALGSDPSKVELAKVASRDLGRTLMFDVVSKLCLSK